MEGDRIRALEVGDAAVPPTELAFLDGIQRYAVEGRIGLVPVVRGYVAAAVLRRVRETLQAVESRSEEFVLAPFERLTSQQRAELEGVGLPLYDCPAAERSHPILDVRLAAKEVETKREVLELEIARRYLEAEPAGWLVVDGALTALSEVLEMSPKVLGLIKSHETQFLDGRDLEVALTLPAAHRTSVFARAVGEHGRVYTWYLRLWPWEEHDLLYGLVRVERAPTDATVDEATAVSRWLLAERAPLAARDGRWDRLIYPIQQVETYLRAQAGGWW
ncbi:MAG: hypothetical protein GTN78_19335 [Gemmatimonadales bacterium]|nr:hypothetical protein [Gemmatimonadales bacterium]NIN13084.1 hypothetical protein [Gemmatimonadales bacterium]NIR02320.1 hypothetical protein [Gemmatimonadales bacterium]NIS66114.1 hypothetical protein [Gemmatimonadales bacterium]